MRRGGQVFTSDQRAGESESRSAEMTNGEGVAKTARAQRSMSR